MDTQTLVAGAEATSQAVEVANNSAFQVPAEHIVKGLRKCADLAEANPMAAVAVAAVAGGALTYVGYKAYKKREV